jgi:hypothetical protein
MAVARRRFTRVALGLLLAGQLFGVSAGAAPDVDAWLETLLATLKQELVRQDPARAAARVVVTNFSEEGLTWATPLTAYLQERTAWLLKAKGMFPQSAVPQTRGITVTQVTGVANPNDPKALAGYYGSELVIDGSYRREGDRVLMQLMVVDDQGRTLARTSDALPMAMVPPAVAAAQVSADNTIHLLGALTRLGPRMQGAWKVDVTTNRPGAGASFRQGEAIQYFVNSTMDGYLYLFHVDADRKIVRIFPNPHQPSAQVRAGAPVEVPGAGAPFRFEASPPFGLETTFAVVTPAPLDEKDFQPTRGGFAAPKGDVSALVGTTRSLRSAPGAGGSPADRPIIWNSITILIRQ